MIPSFTTILNTSKGIESLFGKVKDKLLNNPTEASAKLAVMYQRLWQRGHCHKIMNIYEKYLDRWFNKVLDSQDVQQIKGLFERMNTADGDMIEGIKEITRWLKDESEAILDGDQLDTANKRIKDARIAIQQTRRDIVEALAQMKLLQASFIVSSQTV